ncbi:hypothetical protein A0J61_11865 [Choanephora cucurbitarum]|uniref:Tyr recombinase domain-containing protein n=1 Tax=Choanephora cucurbitarum TaxID=101091 RepID=A0A1C7MK58_9FUNG|nr:hypothetical protein A0J61_11865 [Choanephora cucurbitarum]
MTVISFLSDLHRLKKYQVATLLLARSAVTHFHVDPHSISSYGDIGQYLNRLKSLAPPIRLHRPTIDLTPTFNALRSEESTTITFVRLQRKLAFLLAFVCFLRLSNLDRIPFDSIPIQDNQILTFGIFSPKEKRGHRRIIKSFSVKAHTDPRLRPIATYQALTTFLLFGFFFVNTISPSFPLATRTIGVWLKHYLRLSTTDVRVSVRSLASSLALRAGIPKGDIFTMGNWSGSQVFENYYRREQMSKFDFTSSLLSSSTEDIE